ncbi:PREDICTED: acylpyruvase FAHD1, mitochondrial-like [Rhagoletis zephyria]|uniref:acylpyruvase FAHD1, mitochondrial-like n=1 Tax=Rhagoletis zephyria TaxID=28612 RepID=UPI0008112439|nr:PREDICTED: acylpyruvase FAHD1, mitochondrial-like [Rhagoletis zephyria]KAH9398543.1 Acylpyruvase fahd1, mitochondrial [Tyrophagus putrescentiae]
MRLARFTEFGKKIICVGRNYALHAKEMGHDLSSKPIIFLKPPTAYLPDGGVIKVPTGCKELHHEVELGVIIGRKGSAIKENEASDFIGGYVIALDMTARDFQGEAKKRGEPWSIAKGFDTSCPVGSFIPKESIANPESLKIWLKVNGKVRQEGNTSDMIYKIPFLISYVSQYFTLETGDLILTGTPDGVSAVKDGDQIEIGINDLSKASFTIA